MALLCARVNVIRIIGRIRGFLSPEFPSSKCIVQVEHETHSMGDAVKGCWPPRIGPRRRCHVNGTQHSFRLARSIRLPFPIQVSRWRQKTRIDVCIDVQALRQPAWVSHYLVDLIRTRRIHVCKKLSWPSRFIVDKSDQADYDKLAPYHKRQRINALGTDV